MSDPILLREDQGAVAILTLNHPTSLNALSDAMLHALQHELDQLRKDPAIRVVLLRGSGKAFCPGHDLKEMTAARQAEDKGRGYFQDLFKRCSKMMLSIRDLPQPVIAQVHGVAAAAGCQMVATCDLAICDENSRFGVNGVNVGLFCSTPMVALSRNIQRKKVFEMLTTGSFLNAEEALHAGLVNQVAGSGSLDRAAMDLAQTIASKLGRAVKIGKQAFYNQAEMTLEEAYAYTGTIMAENMLFQETEEAIAAFIEKREPTWQQ